MTKLISDFFTNHFHLIIDGIGITGLLFSVSLVGLLWKSPRFSRWFFRFFENRNEVADISELIDKYRNLATTVTELMDQNLTLIGEIQELKLTINSLLTELNTYRDAKKPIN